jgi:hypothetical protein
MTPAQVAALEKFLVHNDFEYYGYDEELGVVLYSNTLGDWTMEIAYGDECFYCLYNNVTEESNCEELTKVSQIMTEYKHLYFTKATKVGGAINTT